MTYALLLGSSAGVLVMGSTLPVGNSQRNDPSAFKARSTPSAPPTIAVARVKSTLLICATADDRDTKFSSPGSGRGYTQLQSGGSWPCSVTANTRPGLLSLGSVLNTMVLPAVTVGELEMEPIGIGSGGVQPAGRQDSWHTLNLQIGQRSEGVGLGVQGSFCTKQCGS